MKELLSPRQLQVLLLVSKGNTDAEIAEQVGLSIRTVSTHVTKATRKLKAKSRPHAVAIFVKSQMR